MSRSHTQASIRGPTSLIAKTVHDILPLVASLKSILQTMERAMGSIIGSSRKVGILGALALNAACAPRAYNAAGIQATGSASLIDTKLTVMCRMGAQEENPNDSIACGEISFDGTKWHLHARIGVWGAESFAVDYPARAKELADVRAYQTRVAEPNLASEEYFRKVAGEPGGMPQSFEKIPAVKIMIEKQFADISKMYNNDFVETKLEIFFIDTLPIRKKLGLNDNDPMTVTASDFLKPDVVRTVSDKPFVPIKFAPLPNLTYVVPGEFDPYTHPELNGHELFHILNRNHKNDGYIFANYPADGIMNGGGEFRRLRSRGFAPQLNRVELNTLLFNQGELAGFPKERLTAFEPNYYSERGNWSRFANSPPWRGTEEGYKAELDAKLDNYIKSGAKLRRLDPS
jgi:hypothetical protein